MQKSLLILFIGLLIVWRSSPSAGNPNHPNAIGPHISSSVVHLSISNCGDVHLVLQFIVLFYAYDLHKNSITTPVGLTSPIGHLAKQIYVQPLIDVIHFWNGKNGRILLSIREDKADKFSQDIALALKVDDSKLDVVFNDLIGINNLRLSRVTGEIFGYFGSLIAAILGIGFPPTGLLNLNGIINFKTDLPSSLVLDPRKSPLLALCEIGDRSILVKEIASQSILLDAAGYYNKDFIFHDGVFPLQTLSGFVIGTLVGDKSLLTQIEAAVEQLVASLDPTEVPTLLTNLLAAIAVDNTFETAIQIVYANIAPATDEGTTTLDGGDDGVTDVGDFGDVGENDVDVDVDDDNKVDEVDTA